MNIHSNAMMQKLGPISVFILKEDHRIPSHSLAGMPGVPGCKGHEK